MNKAIDTGYAPEKWEFDDEVTRVFDNMLERSIPQYEEMRQIVTRVGKIFIDDNSVVVDLGSSRGEQIARFVDDYDLLNSSAHYVGIEKSPPMLEAMRQRFEYNPFVHVVDHDLKTGLPALAMDYSNAALVTSVLSLMFIPPPCRSRLLADVYDCLVPEGAFIMVEKLTGQGKLIDGVMVYIYQELKHQNGYSYEEIDRKRLSLEDVMVPETAENHIKRLKEVGFREVDCFWRWQNFGAFIGVK